MKTLFKAEFNRGYSFYMTEVIEHAGKKFKLFLENKNGGNICVVQVYTANGDLARIATNIDLGKELEVSYVADVDKKRNEGEMLFTEFKNYLKKIY